MLLVYANIQNYNIGKYRYKPVVLIDGSHSSQLLAGFQTRHVLLGKAPIMKRLFLVCSYFVLTVPLLAFQVSTLDIDAITSRIQQRLDSIYDEETDFGGATLGIVFPDGRYRGLAVGYSDMENKIKMLPEDRMLGGSTGKVFVSAAAMQLVEKGQLGLDDKLSKHLGSSNWYHRIQNADKLTIRNLMRHSSGVSRYVFNDEFLAAALADADRQWKPEELLTYVFDQEPLFEPGTDFAYSDTNYILLAMVLEKISGQSLYELIDKNVLKPHKLKRISPQVNRKMKGLIPGYNSDEDKFYPGKVTVNGEYKYNVQFEWAGGGYIMNPQDLARAGKLIYEGQMFDPSLMDEFLDGVDAKKLRGQWGLGVHIMDTSMGKALGHSGFFPGYITNMLYLVDYKIAIAVQVNSTDRSKPNLYRKMMGSIKLFVQEIDTETNTK